MNRFLFWANIACVFLNVGLFVFGKHHWTNLAVAALNVGAAVFMRYSARNTARISRAVRQ